MWTPTYHRFASRAAFLAACDAAGWPRDPLNSEQPSPPAGAVLVELGPHIARPTVGDDGALAPGAVLDARYHVNAAWHGMEIPASFAAAAITPETPSSGIDVPVRAPPAAPVPPSVAAWKAKAWLHQQGRLEDAEAAAQAAGGVALLAWQGAAEWHRDSTLVITLAAALAIEDAALDAAFIAADAIRG